MNLDQWRAQRAAGTTVTLPSGLEVVLVRTTIEDELIRGNVPESLRENVEAFLSGGVGGLSGLRTLELLGPLALWLAQRVLRGPEGLDASELPSVDLTFIVNWCQRDSFRQQNGGVGDSPDGAGVQREAVEFADGQAQPKRGH